ncbi:Indoleamine 2,3-dioxygenase [Aspergillus pseudonomiae]|uniref:Indoleamine 2,3-dioxygenase n=1 Tax=Aspergillus pseudonomiae TaxID=1506151 RepID=A0A5N7D637_9EURO|nr:Indoleamine 2,3-dioxygenase [Aspergillus pseudonomiae]KAE8401872.1 Indoleamine 2,3-dioxygenase [Aspergillus pseudonomiae]
MECNSIPNLSDYGISPELGFLPAEACLERLPHPYYSPWEKLVACLPVLHKKQQLRSHIEQLPILAVSWLTSPPEWKRAYVCLVFILHGYIWGGSQPRTIIPPCISIPLLAICDRLEVPPIATFAGLCLWNYRLIRPDEPTHNPEDLLATATFTGDHDEEWFYLISVGIEARGAPMIPVMLRAIAGTHVEDTQTLITCLSALRDTLQELGDLLDRMYERCQPAVFYHRLRPFLAGTKSLEQYGLPDGIYFDVGTTNTNNRMGSPKLESYRGGSNAQSSLIQFFDIVLGVKHPAAPGAEGTTQHSFHDEMRGYMPGPHRRFLADISRVARVREYVHARRGSHPDLAAGYESCLQMLNRLRAKHLRIVSDYIIKEARRGSVDGSHNSGAVQPAPRTKAASRRFLGTGGTDLIPFLKRTIDESVEPLRKLGVR